MISSLATLYKQFLTRADSLAYRVIPKPARGVFILSVPASENKLVVSDPARTSKIVELMPMRCEGEGIQLDLNVSPKELVTENCTDSSIARHVLVDAFPESVSKVPLPKGRALRDEDAIRPT